MFQNPRRSRQARNFCNKCSKNSRSQIVFPYFRTDIFRKLTLGAGDILWKVSRTNNEWQLERGSHLMVFTLSGIWKYMIYPMKTGFSSSIYLCRTCHFHLSYIIISSKIGTYLDCESTEAIIHACMTTNLDYCNAILYGLPKVLLNRLQLVQNRAACIVTLTTKYSMNILHPA